jgi:polyhydroxybutyrate depolymerase
MASEDGEMRMFPRSRRRSIPHWIAAVAAACLAVGACASGADDPTSGDRTAGPSATTAADDSTTTAATTSSTGCDTATPAPPGTTDRTMTSGGRPRQFQLIVPESYDGTEPLPIVFSLHPDVISYKIIPPMVGFPDMAAQRDFIGVSPSGLVDGTIPWWMAVRTEPPGHDITYFSDLLDLLETELCVDPSRVYATGMANGAQMASLLACQLGDRVTAVAPLAGPEWPTACNGRPVPVVAFMGDKDPFVSYQDGRGDAAEIAGRHFWKEGIPPDVARHEGAEHAMANWAAHNGCDAEPDVENISAEVVRTRWQNCDAETVFYHVVGGGHTWPSRPVPAFEAAFGHTTMDIDATQLMFDFFFDHQR